MKQALMAVLIVVAAGCGDDTTESYTPGDLAAQAWLEGCYSDPCCEFVNVPPIMEAATIYACKYDSYTGIICTTWQNEVKTEGVPLTLEGNTVTVGDLSFDLVEELWSSESEIRLQKIPNTCGLL
jgi:hypothetical protein